MDMAGTHRTETKSPGNKRAGKRRSADDIAAEIEATCLNISSNIASLEKLAKPAKFAARGLGSAGAFFLDDKGEIRRDRVISVVAAGFGLFSVLTRSRKN